MAQRVDIAIIGDDAGAHAMLNALSGAMSPMKMGRFATETILPWLERRAIGRFANEGDDAVGDWAPLMRRTQEIRSQLGFGAAHPINRRTGELEEFITTGGADIVAAEDGMFLQFPRNPSNGELYSKLATAQMGKSDPRTLPRPVVGLSATDLSFVLTQLALHVTEEVHLSSGAGVNLVP